METSCAKCLAQITHDPEATKIQCASCGHVVVVSEDLPPIDGPSFEEVSSSAPAETPPSTAAASAPPVEYAESERSFAEIRAYGEEVSTTALKQDSPVDAPKAVTVSDSAGSSRMTTGSGFEGVKVKRYLPPISLMHVLSAERPDPLEGAWAELWQLCEKRGGNALIGIQWAVSPDFSKVLVSGVPVVCS